MIRAKPTAGFTLIEILVVIVIIAVMVSVSMLSMNVLGKDSEIESESRRLAGLIGMVREQAEMQGRDYGLRFGDTSYEFVSYRPRTDEWTGAEDDPLLKPRTLPAGLRMRLYLEAREVVLKPLDSQEKDEGLKDAKGKPLPPQVFILSNGDLSSFELKLEREGSDHEATLIGKAEGTVEVQGADHEKT